MHIRDLRKLGMRAVSAPSASARAGAAGKAA